MVCVMLSLLPAIRMAFRPLMNRLRPLLATLPKSDVRITGDDMRRAMNDMNTSKQLRRQAGLIACIAAMSLAQLYFQHLGGRSVMSGDPLSIPLLCWAVLASAVAVIVFRQAMRKAKQEWEESRVR